MTRRLNIPGAVLVLLVAAAPLSAQISFPKTGYYAGLGDSVAAGSGAIPATNGYVYRLYDQGVFGSSQSLAFTNASVRAATSWDLRDHQVPQILCTGPDVLRPSIVTITAGANDFFRGDFNVFGIAQRVAEAVNLLLHNPQLPQPILDPITGQPCPALENVTILASNYYSIPHPVPAVFDQLDALLRGFDQSLRFWISQIDVPAGSRLAIVDLYSPSFGRQGLVVIERRLGFPGPGPFDFDPHPTNLGHAFIAGAFKDVWKSLQP